MVYANLHDEVDKFVLQQLFGMIVRYQKTYIVSLKF